jgi:ABC-type oligopeptide transport system substrate-binding subunit
VVYDFIADGNTAFSGYQTAALDQINVPIADVTVVRNDPVLSKQAHLLPELTVFWMTYNTKVAPLDNVDVRMASKSIDRDKLVNDVEHGTDKATESLPGHERVRRLRQGPELTRPRPRLCCRRPASAPPR